MTNRSRRGLFISIVVTVITGFAAAYLIPKVCIPNRSGNPLRQNVLGSKLEVLSVKRLSSGEVDMKLRLKPKLMSKGVECKLGHTTVNGQDTDNNNTRISKLTFSEYNQEQLGISLKLPNVTKFVTIRQEVYLARKSRERHFIFKNVDPQKLPLTQRINGFDVTIKRAYQDVSSDAKRLVKVYGCPLIFLGPDPSRGYASILRGFAIEVDLKSPSGYTWTSIPSVKDESGHTMEPTSFWINKYATAGTQPSYDPTFMENVVGLVDKSKSDKMRTNRFHNAIGASSMTNSMLLVYQPTNSHLKKFAIDIQGRFKADPKDKVWVEFKNIPIAL